MKYKVTLNGKIYEVMVERGCAILADEYDAPVQESVPVVSAPKESVQPAAAAPAVVPAPAAKVAPSPSPAAAPASPSAGGESVKAPLPGTVLKIKAGAGTQVQAGDVVIILEAMKMENEITAPCAGTVSEMLVAEGKAVKSGDDLFIIK